jgi:peptidyl-prolyl cis-trans isomerase SurA
VAAQFAGTTTLPQLENRTPDQLPSVLAQQIAGTAPGQGFTVPVTEVGGVVVGFIGSVTVPSFEDSRAQLAQQAASDAEDAGAALVTAVRDDLDVDVNPRYGKLDEGRVVAADDGVVKLLEAADPAGAGN